MQIKRMTLSLLSVKVTSRPASRVHSCNSIGSLRKYHVEGECNVVFLQSFLNYSKSLCLQKILELNWNQRFRDKKTKLNPCHHMLMSYSQLENRAFHVVERTRTSAKCQKMFFIIKHANLWRSLGRRSRGCVSSLMSHVFLCRKENFPWSLHKPRYLYWRGLIGSFSNYDGNDSSESHLNINISLLSCDYFAIALSMLAKYAKSGLMCALLDWIHGIKDL